MHSASDLCVASKHIKAATSNLAVFLKVLLSYVCVESFVITMLQKYEKKTIQPQMTSIKMENKR